MTVPVVSNVHMMDDGNTFEKDVETAFYLPAEFQTNPPQPSDPDINILHREPIRVIARSEHHHLLTPTDSFNQIKLLIILIEGSKHEVGC